MKIQAACWTGKDFREKVQIDLGILILDTQTRLELIKATEGSGVEDKARPGIYLQSFSSS